MDGQHDQAPHPRMVRVWAWRSFLFQVATWLSWVVVGLGVGFAVTGEFWLLLLAVVLVLAAIVVSYVWANLYIRFYRWRLGEEEMQVWRGILFRKRITIPYMRIQNVNVARGPLLLLYKLSGVEVETAGQRGPPGGPYLTEGYLPGVEDGEAVADYIIEKVKRAKAREGL